MSTLYSAAQDRYDLRCHKKIRFDADKGVPQGDRVEIAPSAALPGVLALRLRGLLSPSECGRLVAAAEQWGFESVAWEYEPNYRSCTRVVAMCPELADTLWGRVLGCLRPSDLQTADDPSGGCRPVGFGAEGVWRPVGVNPCMRFSKYDGSGHFAPHRDSTFVVDDNRRSVLTIMAYLTEGFEGGETTFFSEHTRGIRDEEGGGSGACDAGAAPRAPRPGALAHRAVPALGDGIVFSHQVWHAGEAVSAGAKIILRTDVMFERSPCSSFRAPPASYAASPVYQWAEALFRESIALQREGDPAGSTAAFVRALELHATLPAAAEDEPLAAPARPLFGSAEPGSALAELTAGLPDNVFALILEDLGESVVCRSAMVSRAWNHATSTSEAWLSFFRRAFGEAAVVTATESSVLPPTGSSTARPDAAEGGAPRDAAPASRPHSAWEGPSESARAALVLGHDWKATYRETAEAKLTGRVLVVDVGCDSTKFTIANEELVDGRALIAERLSSETQEWHRRWIKSEMLRKGMRFAECGTMWAGGEELSTAATSREGQYDASERRALDLLSGGTVRQPAMIPSVVGRMAGHYWSAGQGISQFLVGNECEDGSRGLRWAHNDFQRRRLWLCGDGAGWRLDPCACGILLNWLMQNAFGRGLSPAATPLLFAVPSAMGEREREELATALAGSLEPKEVRNLWAPPPRARWGFFTDEVRIAKFARIQIVSSSVLALRSIDRASGVVVDAGCRRIEVAVVLRGAVQGAIELPCPEAAADAAGGGAGDGEAEGEAGEQRSLTRKDRANVKRRAAWLHQEGGTGSAASLANDTSNALQQLVASAAQVEGGVAREELLQCVLLAGGSAVAFAPFLRPALAAAGVSTLLVPVTAADAALAVVRGAQLAAGVRVARREVLPVAADALEQPLPAWVERVGCDVEGLA